MLNFFSMMGNYDQRKVENSKVGDGEVDTALVTDSTKPYETGIRHPAYRDGDWIIVQLYSTKNEAIEGHKRWCNVMSVPPEYLDDVNECEFEQLASELGVSQRGRFPRQST